MMKSGSSQEEPLFCHKILTKKCRKPLDFCSRDEYNTFSTQRNGVLNTGNKENESFRAKKSLSLYLIFIIGGQEL